MKKIRKIPTKGDMSWIVALFDVNAQKIKPYNILAYREDLIKGLKKKFLVKEDFAEALRREIMYQFWSRSEYELIVERLEDGRIQIVPWCGCFDKTAATILVTTEFGINWHDFANFHIGKQIYKDSAKVDVYDQVMFCFDAFIDYCWNFHHKYWRYPKSN